MIDVVHLSDDLIFASRVAGVARDLGLDCVTVRSSDVLKARITDDRPACVVIDLANPGLQLADVLASLPTGTRPRIVAYGSHVDVAGLRVARAAGCDDVLPRSQFVEELPVKISQWAGRV